MNTYPKVLSDPQGILWLDMDSEHLISCVHLQLYQGVCNKKWSARFPALLLHFMLE